MRRDCRCGCRRKWKVRNNKTYNGNDHLNSNADRPASTAMQGTSKNTVLNKPKLVGYVDASNPPDLQQKKMTKRQ